MNAELKHTPGPWFQAHRPDSEGMYSTEVFDKEGVTIATLAWYPYTIGNTTHTLRDPNAKLIAAAPDLLKALEEYIFNQTGQYEKKRCRHDFFCICSSERAEAAIAKATT
jgi:hypothetical protein